ncbi:class I SAM-dependent methyltransferase [Streptomyces antimycoticus]|uniref:class I SAM-dependent methyltransferase n=1 Tax=Streptomyces antimycoticus TaxID=68175 RepID=UPI00257038FC|nr:class I SAM-dependent methyltransferase [Streptomyces antimycoticus]WJD98460.1 class I SAM-dependent methyltransferase [Streptomyces antimycoticus]
MDAQFWDDLYRSRDQLFSGAPNGVLVTEITDLPLGQALDVGCGEGADAIWLARRGWQVTAVDISRAALERAVAAATDVQGRVAWTRADLTGTPPPAATDVQGRVAWTRADLTGTPPPAAAFDLVSVHYFPLAHQPDHTALRGLLDAVAPGGTLLFATHALADLSPDPERDFDPGDYYQPDEIARLLDDDWTVLINETRPRTAPAPAGTHHTQDTVLRARRLR